ncbi:MAG: hypothetical protein A2675_00695 [Candidatus Yonathbacteria bacterium RIFCSPHIGHO2_01_FULL_51_10]|uniref:Uncharacterized protein n=1 Tax=Candidatus Yonathbacteria bacterium RIFCSPHIGHO2_01_FULL_51_10 TaxID=1802723 RepID=A0A1G2S6K0_9BACT|nr:MAG: hypothetical protein A2675_00695 [Candidatus Yonathbacteria bacterium RIFCSPHIGHO2_01_FULL_51_10]
MTSKRNTVLIVVSVLLSLFVVYGGIFYYQHVRSGQQVSAPGETPGFDEGTTTEDTPGVATGTPPVANPCVVGGCSNEICSDESVIGICIYREEFACYRTAKCERQENGSCGWTETLELRMCLDGGATVPTEIGTTTAL